MGSMFSINMRLWYCLLSYCSKDSQHRSEGQEWHENGAFPTSSAFPTFLPIPQPREASRQETTWPTVTALLHCSLKCYRACWCRFLKLLKHQNHNDLDGSSNIWHPTLSKSMLESFSDPNPTLPQPKIWSKIFLGSPERKAWLLQLDLTWHAFMSNFGKIILFVII